MPWLQSQTRAAAAGRRSRRHFFHGEPTAGGGVEPSRAAGADGKRKKNGAGNPQSALVLTDVHALNTPLCSVGRFENHQSSARESPAQL